MESGAHHSEAPWGVNDPSRPMPAWKAALRSAIRDVDVLCDRLGLDSGVRQAAHAARGLFPLLVTESFLARMQPGDPHDPLLAQVLPRGEEALPEPGYGADPVGESACSIAPGLLQKYHGRALLISTSACAVHCRYCFRRHFPYDEVRRPMGWWRPALARIAEDPSIEELILSGGDPLCLDDEVLARLVHEAEAIPHLRRLRLHTRLPVVLPERVDEPLCAWLAATRLQTAVVLHANHPAEIDAHVIAACRRLAAQGVVLLNQAVLLRGVNADAGVLADLSRAVFAAGVLPYYLHVLDRVAGAAHFAIDDDQARALVAALAATLPGYLVPRLVREELGATSKTAITALTGPGQD